MKNSRTSMLGGKVPARESLVVVEVRVIGKNPLDQGC